jgi:hypothetical protein
VINSGSSISSLPFFGKPAREIRKSFCESPPLQSSVYCNGTHPLRFFAMKARIEIVICLLRNHFAGADDPASAGLPRSKPFRLFLLLDSSKRARLRLRKVWRQRKCRQKDLNPECECSITTSIEPAVISPRHDDVNSAKQKFCSQNEFEPTEHTDSLAAIWRNSNLEWSYNECETPTSRL